MLTTNFSFLIKIY